MDNTMLNLITDNALTLDRQLQKQFPAIFNIQKWHSLFDQNINKISFQIHLQNQKPKKDMFYYETLIDEQIQSQEPINSAYSLCKDISNIQDWESINKSQITKTQLQKMALQKNGLQAEQMNQKSKGYPTKNLLPNFKGPHFAYIDRFLGKQQLQSIDFIKAIRQKNGINLNDYDTLYKIPQLKKIFRQFFARKVLYRELLLSRSTLLSKKIYIRKLYVFEKGFKANKFDKIN